MNTQPTKAGDIIFEYKGLSVTEYDSLYQIGRNANGVVLATVMKVPPEKSKSILGSVARALSNDRIKGLAIAMVKCGY